MANQNEGHRQRLRHKFLKSGLDGFHDYEIIELLLTLGTPRKDCKSVAREALKKFGTLKSVLEVDPSKLKEIKGIGDNNVFGLKITQAVSRREVVKRALDHAAAALVFVHNHPSGNLKPSQDDITITKKLKEAVEAIDVSVHDHLIIVGNKVYSFADHGLI